MTHHAIMRPGATEGSFSKAPIRNQPAADQAAGYGFAGLVQDQQRHGKCLSGTSYPG